MGETFAYLIIPKHRHLSQGVFCIQTRESLNLGFTEPYRQSDEYISDYKIEIRQESFILQKADYQDLVTKDNSSSYMILATGLLVAAITYGITMFIRYFVGLHQEEPADIPVWEILLSFVAYLFVGGGLYYRAKKVPSKKKELLGRMKRHFETSPVSVDIIPKEQ